ncbi:MAG: hypothetical protein LH481_07770 [Burkholderiales bacterium]|nr:hypothetical protein [Burkholderiales bacterium]
MILFSSGIFSSWQLLPIVGMGRECGNDIFSPRCSRRINTPPSTLAQLENGGVFI